MNWQKIKPFLLALISALFVIFVSGIAVANNQAEIKDVIRMGNDITVTEKQTLTDVVSIAGSVTLLNGAQVTGDAVAIGGDVTLKANSRVAGDAVAIGGQVIQEEGASLGGSEVSMFTNAKVLFDRFGLFGTLYIANTIFSIVSLIVIFAFGIFLLLLLPGHLQTITATINHHPFKSGMWGLGGIIVVTLFIALFAGSVLGFLLIPIVNLAFAVAGLLGAIATGLWIGQKILPSRNAPWLIPFSVGMLLLVALTLIPIAGGLIVLMLDLFGFGAVLLSRVGTVEPETIKKRFDQLEGNIQPSGT
jgi:hypothetical protein